MRAVLALGFLVAVASACGDDLLGEGKTCTSSAECAAGLLCNTAQDPPVCAKTGPQLPDLHAADQAAPVVDLAGADLAGADLATVDLSVAVVVDMATAVDLAQND